MLLTGIPLLCFAGFTLTVFVSSLVTALLGAIVVTLCTTAFAIFAASLLLLPTVFFTTIGALFLYLWGLIAYYIFVYFQSSDTAPSDNAFQTTDQDQSDNVIQSTNVDPSDNAIQSTADVHSDNAIDGKVHNWSGGRLSWTSGPTTKAIDRPKVEAKDSAVGLEQLEDESVQRNGAMASEVHDESDVDPHLSSLTESIRSEIASPGRFTILFPQQHRVWVHF